MLRRDGPFFIIKFGFDVCYIGAFTINLLAVVFASTNTVLCLNLFFNIHESYMQF